MRRSILFSRVASPLLEFSWSTTFKKHGQGRFLRLVANANTNTNANANSTAFVDTTPDAPTTASVSVSIPLLRRKKVISQ